MSLHCGDAQINSTWAVMVQFPSAVLKMSCQFHKCTIPSAKSDVHKPACITLCHLPWWWHVSRWGIAPCPDDISQESITPCQWLVWQIDFGRGYKPVIRQTAKWMMMMNIILLFIGVQSNVFTWFAVLKDYQSHLYISKFHMLSSLAQQ
jgi:hypothetical protein